ncbi:MAG TPA: hypothetical protein DEQ09_13440 [Bacteroidales bacterium]|nr:hypothetical protein [Bacteroidales bacterium]
MNQTVYSLLVFTIIIYMGCTGNNTNKQESMKNTRNIYGEARDFLDKYTDIVELKGDRSAVLIAPAWQGRVMTSTCEGEEGFSFGWINRELISSGDTMEHINPYGGEERLWLGPEGGQYALFFKKGDPFEYEYWRTPALMDTQEFILEKNTDDEAAFMKKGKLLNYSGYEFNFHIRRKIELLDNAEIESVLGIETGKVNAVAYRSENILKNTGKTRWSKDKGLISIWMLGMFNVSPSAVVIIPVKEGDEKDLGPVVNDNYFGTIPDDRLQVKENIIFFKADGLNRGKIGIPPLRSKNIMASYDQDNNALTILLCDIPGGETEFVNSAWELQEEPFKGDALNSYNDGPLEDGSIMGPFYELETSSPALSLNPGEEYNHIQTTIHITGTTEKLNDITLKLLGTTLENL